MNLGVMGSGGLGVTVLIKARGEFEVWGGKGLDVVVSKGVWNRGEEWVNKNCTVSPTE